MLHRPLYRRKAGYSFIRSLNPAAWFRADTGVTVTGLGASMVADQADADNALVLPGVAGNYASAPDSVPLSFAGDFGVAAKFSMDDWTPAAAGTIVIHATNLSTGFAFSLQISTGGVPILYTSADGTTILTHTATAATGVTNGETKWVGATMDVDDGGGNRVVKFYLSDDGDSWTQLGTTVTTAGATSIFDATGPLTIGMSNTSQQPWAGRAYRVRVFASETLTGTPVFDANFAAQTKGTTSFSESSSNAATVTVNQSGALPAHIGSQKDLLQGTAASRPPYLSYSGTKYLYLPGVAGNYASTPDSVPASITGNIDIRVRVQCNDWTPAANSVFISKLLNAGQYGYDAYLETTGAIVMRHSQDGTVLISATSSVATGFTDGDTKWLRITRSSSSGDVNFYTAADSATEPTSWTQLGTTQSTAAGSMFNGTDALQVGGNASLQVSGRIYRAIIKNGIDGTTVVDFNPDLDGSDQAATITSSATGEVWTINKSGGLPAQIVARPSLLFDGSADYLKCNAFTLNQPETVYIAFKQVSWTNADHIFDGNASDSGVLYQTNLTPNIVLYAGTANAATNGNLSVGAYGVVCALFNGASSLIQVNNTTATTGNPGASNMGGFTLGAIGAGSSSWANIQVLEVLVFSAAHDATQRARIIQYLAGRHGIAL